jgi:phytoene synthase
MTTDFLETFKCIDFERIHEHPNILIAACFWEDERYQAAKTCYRYMRAIDDLIDGHKSKHVRITADEKQLFMDKINAWKELASGNMSKDPVHKDLISTIRKFQIPIWPLEAFARSMIYDIDHNGFATLDDFMEYTQGASVAPASIFVHLSGLIHKDSFYAPPQFDVKSVATPCAVFSYIVHIIRDFQKDQLNNLNYFADDLLMKQGLNPQYLKEIAVGAPIPQEFRNVVGEYLQLADHYREKTYQVIRDIWPVLEPRYRLSLQIIFNLYLMVFERIDSKNGSFTANELNPTPGEIRERVYQTIKSFK